MNMPRPFVKKPQKTSSKEHTGHMPSKDQKSCFDLEDLLQFEAARERALGQADPRVYQPPFTDFVPHRVFVNQVDTFNGSHIVDYLSNVTLSPEEEFQGEEGETFTQETIPDEDRSDEGDEEEKLTSQSSDSVQKKITSDVYEIIGSLEFLNNPKYRRPEGILELLDNQKKKEFLEKVLTCGFIIYDITSDLYCHPKQVEEAKWVLESIVKRLEMYEKNKPKEFSKYSHCRIFILISTLMTWAKTKPIDPEDPSLPFTEKDFRKRKPHPNYKIHCELEKRVIELGKMYPKNLKTIVVGSGVTYGHEEDILHFLFKMAWENEPYLPIFKPGSNIIPVIHVDSLASIIQLILQNFPDKYKYIIATDPHSVTLKEIVKLLAKYLGNGKTKKIDKEEAFLFPDIKVSRKRRIFAEQRNYDMLSTSINIVPGYILENMVVRWGTEYPFSQNIPNLISEFKTARELLPIKIFIHGPPASGKTFLAKRLAHYYDIPHLYEKGLVEDTIKKLKEQIQAKEKEEEELKVKIEGDTEEPQEEEMDDDVDTDEEDVEALKGELHEIEESLQNNGNRLHEDLLSRLFKNKLSSNYCMNKGYVIDGYPETIEETKMLYAPPDEDLAAMSQDEEEGQEENLAKLCNLSILPGYVESLDASDEFLINRVVRLPIINMTEFEEHEMCRRLTEFRALNTEDNTPLIFYDEMDVHPMIYNVENDPDIHMIPTFNAIINHIGPPKNYKKDLISMEDVFPEQAEENFRANQAEILSNFTKTKETLEERRKKMEKWMFQKNQAIEMEEKALVIMGMPLRHYLMKYVFPCLTRGLVEVARIRPDDPVDFLSEFLFRENPEGKMFQPDYEEKERKLAEAVKDYESMMGGSSPRSSKKSFSTDKSPRSDAVSRVTNYKCSFISSSRTGRKRTTSISEKSNLRGKPSSVDSGALTTGKSSLSSMGICTCQRSPSQSLSTCSSDRSPSTSGSALSCTCTIAEPEPCEPCEPCEEEKKVDPCVCPCNL